MSLPSLATVEEFAVWLDQTIASDDARATDMLIAASGLVRDAAGQTWVDDDGELVENIPTRAVTLTKVAASRGWLNPAGASRQAKTLGPRSTDTSWDAAGVALTEDERAELAALTGGPNAGINGLSSITVRAPRGTSPSHGARWADTDDGYCW